MDEEKFAAMARKLTPDVLKALSHRAENPKASPRDRAKARKVLEQRRLQLRQLADNPKLRADVRRDVESALRAFARNADRRK